MPAMATALGIVRNAKSKADKDHKQTILDLTKDHATELNKERENMKGELRELIKILNGLTTVLSSVGHGVDREIPNRIKMASDQILSKIENLTTQINSLNNEQ